MSETTKSTAVENKFFETLGRIPSSIAYIPSRTDPNRAYFSKFKDHFLKIGVGKFTYCDFDQEFSIESWEILRTSDCAYLSGGFTPYFLETLRAKDVIKALVEFSQSRPLIGVSAGGIIMGQDITILSESPDEGPATRALEIQTGLGLYEHHFYPHFKNKLDEIKLITARSAKEKKVIVACDDFSGLIIDGSKTFAIGTAQVFSENSSRVVHDGILIR